MFIWGVNCLRLAITMTTHLPLVMRLIDSIQQSCLRNSTGCNQTRRNHTDHHGWGAHSPAAQMSFSEEICALYARFIWRIHGNQPRNQNRLIALVVTFPTSYCWFLLLLLAVDLCISYCILRCTVVEFHQRETDMKVEICSKKAQFVLKGLLLVADFLQRNPDSSVDIFCNSRK